MARGNIKMSLKAIKSSKWRSLLTVLGISIGIASVVTITSLGEGAKRQLVGQVHKSGHDLITIRPGRLVNRDPNGKIQSVNVLSGFTFGSLSEADLVVVRDLPEIAESAPFAYISGAAKADDREFVSGPVIATTENAASILNQKIEYGNFFTPGDNSKQVAVIGKRVAEQFFEENVPIGRKFVVRGQTFVVQGVFEEFTTSPFSLNADYNYAIFIPYESGKHLAGGQAQLFQILAKPTSAVSSDPIGAVNAALAEAHGGQTDFTVLTASENLSVVSGVLDIMTAFVVGIAAISLLVGGVGIMNIMLVSTTERTGEVGIRKAIGATNRQIMNQFMTEAVILSLIGGLFGVILSLVANYFMRVFTDLTPVVTPVIIIVAIGVSLVIGVVFGVMPAARAARKDPIDALRYE